MWGARYPEDLTAARVSLQSDGGRPGLSSRESGQQQRNCDDSHPYGSGIDFRSSEPPSPRMSSSAFESSSLSSCSTPFRLAMVS
jgi:hypothetical protein